MTMQTMIPFVPEDAPFSTEQRAWLNGFLAGMFSSASASGTEKREPLRIAVLYASQSGTAEGLARKLTKELKSKGHAAALTSLEAYTPKALAAEKYAVLIASTYGEGEAPDAAQPFYEELCIERFPALQELNYAVFGLGDRHYEHFCKFSIDLDGKLAALGAARLCERVECDLDIDEPFAQWKEKLLGIFNAMAKVESAPAAEIAAPVTAATETQAETAAAHGRENPFSAPVIEKRVLTRESSSKVTLHMTLSIRDSGLRYEAGDACGIIPQNDPKLVEEILQRLKLTGQEMVEAPGMSVCTVADALLHRLVITRLSRKLIERYATAGGCTTLLGMLAPEQQAKLEQYIYERGLIDLLVECPGVVRTASELTAMLPKLTPRLYSISSSPLAHSGEVHTTVAVVRYNTLGRERGGVCSTLLADRLPVGEQLPIYIQPNRKFRLPADASAPVIMIGPGTGIAPFRAFLHERRALGARGRNWLFFGERSAASDFLYREELEAMAADGHLTRLDTAFSRDQEQKVYVQDRMLEQGPMLWSWLEDGASVYVCGDASRMAKDVDRTLHAIVAQHGGMEQDAAREYVNRLKDEHRYHRDVY